jgi:hypothetical protein
MQKLFRFKFILLGVLILAIAFIALFLTSSQSNTPKPQAPATQTPSPTSFSEQQERTLQRNLDEKTAQGVQENLQANPWTEQVPSSTEDYFIGTNITNDGFFVYIYPKKSSSISIDRQTENIKAEVINFLNKIGAPTDKIEWVVSPR